MAVVECLVPQILTRHNSRSNSWKLGLLESGVEVFLRGGSEGREKGERGLIDEMVRNGRLGERGREREPRESHLGTETWKLGGRAAGG